MFEITDDILADIKKVQTLLFGDFNMENSCRKDMKKQYEEQLRKMDEIHREQKCNEKNKRIDISKYY